MKILKRMGLKIHPWGTPLIIVFIDEYCLLNRIVSRQERVFTVFPFVYGPYGSTKWYMVRKSHLISGTYADALFAVTFVQYSRLFITVTNFYKFLFSFPDPL